MKAAVSPHSSSEALDEAPIAYAALDHDWRIQYVNRAALAIGGRTREELVGASIWELIGKPETGFEEACRCAVAKQETVEFEQYHPRREAWYWLRVEPAADGVRLWAWDITPRHEAQERLERSERRKAAVIDASLDATVSTSGDGMILEFNTAAEKLFGYTREEAIGRRVGTLLIPPDRRPGHYERLRRHAIAPLDELAKPFRSEFVRKDGVRFPVEMALTRVEVEDGVVFTAFVHDLTTEGQHSSLIEDLHAIVWEYDAVARRMSYINGRAQEILGYAPSCWLDDNDDAFWLSIIHPDDQPRVRELWRNIESGELVALDFEYRALAADGRTIWIRDFVRVMRDEDGVFVRARGVAVDITQEREADERLRRTNELLSTLVESSPLAIVSIDADRTVRTWNPACEELFGWSAPEVVGGGIPTLTEDDDLRGELERGAEVRNLETEWLARDGRRIPVLVNATRLAGANGAMCVVTDLTARRAAERALREQEDAFREFVGDVDALVWEWDMRERRYTFASGGFEKILGLDPRNWLENPWFAETRLLPDDLAVNKEILREGIRLGADSVQLEYREVAADGHAVVLRDHVRITRDENGRALRLRGVAMDVTEQRTVERRLRAQEARFRSLVEQLPLAVYRETVEDGFATTYVSPQVEEIFGYPSEKWTSEPHFYDSLIDPEDWPRVVAALERTRRNGDPFHEVFRVRHADGSVVWVEDHSVVVEDDAGPTLQGYILDVTARKDAESMHEESERRYRRLVEQLPLSVYVNDLDLDKAAPIYMSPQIEDILGYPVDDWYADPGLFDKLLHPDDREHVAEESRIAAETGMFHSEYRLFARDGRTVWIEHAAVRIDGDAGKPIVQGYMLDVTERKQADSQRYDAELRFRSLVENLPHVSYTNAVQGAVESLYMSPQVEQMLGYTAEEWVGSPGFFESILHPDDHDEVMAAVTKAHEEGTHFAREYRLIAADGRVVWIHDESAPVVGRNGELVFIQGYFSDVTHRKELEHQLVQAQKMEAVGRLAGGIAHDFNNLLTAIGGYAEFLIAGLPTGDPLREDANEIARATDRAAGLTRQLLAFSRRQVLQPRAFDLNEVVTDMEAMLRRLIGEDVKLCLDLDEDVLPVRADPNQIEQVIMNLAVNARDAMPGGGRVTIRTYESSLGGGPDDTLELVPGAYSVMEVLDTGTGMDPDVLSQLFDPFFTTKEKGKGTGLGLATVYGIVKQSGGDIAVTSVLGEGSSFRVYLPHASDQDDARIIRPVPPPGGGAELVLLVEDEDAVRALVSETLRRYGYAVVDAAGADEALESVALLRPDILVTDIVMPGTGGHELAARVRERHPDAAVLYMSGYTDDAIVRDTLADPSSVFLQKPFGAETLARKVREALDARRAA